MDQADARVPGAKVLVKNEGNGDSRTTVSDSQGFFAVTALPPGTYTVTVSAKGFASFEETTIVLSQGDTKSVNARLKISSNSTDVTVVSGVDAEVPTDTAEVSATLNNELVDSAILTTRNAAELVKMMPGVAFSGSGGQNETLSSGTNSGPAGSFSANGTQPYGTLDVYLDGANLIDPGNAGTQVANINQDMTDSVKYLSASYGAEYAKGPAVLQAFSKSGTQKFHGEGYLYARNSNIGFANDWLSNYQGAPLQNQSYYYMGGNVGGPIFFPHFNHNRDKLFFWGGYEYMKQNPYVPHAQMNTVTDFQSKGDFSAATTEAYAGAGLLGSSQSSAYVLPCAAVTAPGGWPPGCTAANSPWVSTDRSNLSQFFDPVGKVLGADTNNGGLLPVANRIPTAANGWTNYLENYSSPSSSATVVGNRWEATGKITYAFNDNNKLWGSYAYQSEADTHGAAPWWNPPNSVEYPSLPIGKETAHLYLANYTHVFSATSTNEVVFAYAKFVNDMSGSKPGADKRATYSIPEQTVFSGKTASPQIPNTSNSSGWVTTVPWINFPALTGGIYGPNSFGKTSQAPSISDVFTKIIGTHSIKAGFYWDAQENIQSTDGQDGAGVQGNYEVANWGSSSTSNVTLDRLMGRNYAYEEVNTDPVPDELWHQWSIWGQDQWKATRKVTLTFGLRADHMGQWYDKLGPTQVWDPSTYVNTSNAPANTGLVWHNSGPQKGAANAVSSIPASGFPSRLFVYAPRVGVAYDLFGNGRTVLRSGFGVYYYQISNNYAGQAMTGPLGSFQYDTATNAGLNGFYTYSIAGGVINNNSPQNAAGPGSQQLSIPQGLNQNGSSPTADKLGDNAMSHANTYSFGVAQALPAHTVMEISYVGSTSRNQFINTALQNINGVPYGAFVTPDPVLGGYRNTSPTTGSNGANTNNWRPMQNYSDLFVGEHTGYSNYNSLQISGQKQSGNLYLYSNFTFGKVLGTRDGGGNGNGATNGNIVDPFNLANNYGPLAFDHTKIFNLSASYKLPSPIHHNAVLGQVVNGWQLSTYTTYQDGQPLQSVSANLNMNYQNPNKVLITQAFPAGAVVKDSAGNVVGPETNSNPSASIWYGTNLIPQMQPVLTCDPRNGLRSGQKFNPNCFRAPLPPTTGTFGETGQTVWPYVRTPHYFGSDLAIFKAFRVNDSQRFEVRVSATNWLNHPNANFGNAGSNSDDTLYFNGIPTGSQNVTNSEETTTGTPQAKSGFRWIQFAGKYYF
jgi:Carboxypeptidase regulatory-like domain/TonB-dependent Receptor Plug Domain